MSAITSLLLLRNVCSFIDVVVGCVFDSRGLEPRRSLARLVMPVVFAARVTHKQTASLSFQYPDAVKNELATHSLLTHRLSLYVSLCV